MFLKGWACFLFLDPQDEVGPSISSSVVLLLYIVVLSFGSLFVSILCTCCSHFSWYCFIPFTMFCDPVFCLIHWCFSLSSFVIPSKCLKNFICAASKRCSSLFFSTKASLPNFNAALAVMLRILNFVSLFICFPKCLRIAPFILLYVCNLSSKTSTMLKCGPRGRIQWLRLVRNNQFEVQVTVHREKFL